MTEASALEQIRQVELAEARRLEEAGDEDRATLAAARRQADRMVEEARARGAAEADEWYRRAIAAAEQRAAEIAAAGAVSAEQIKAKAAARVDEAVESMVRLILARPGEEIG
jgi:vacuolar-type H+-ATPase subunit H